MKLIESNNETVIVQFTRAEFVVLHNALGDAIFGPGLEKEPAFVLVVVDGLDAGQVRISGISGVVGCRTF